MKRVVSSQDAPSAVGAYSQAIATADLVFTAGQIPATPAGELLDDESVAVQTEQSIENVRALLEAEDLGLDDVVKTTVYLDDIETFEEMNDVYGDHFADDPPARSAIEAGALPKGVGVEIEAIATRS
jgi:reactive intermediate/imine deaminase